MAQYDFNASGFVNVSALGNSKLAAGITAGAASATVNSASVAATWQTANFAIRVDNELVYVTSRSGTTLTLGTRGLGGTTAADHNAGAKVYVVVPPAAYTAAFDILGNIFNIDADAPDDSFTINSAGRIVSPVLSGRLGINTTTTAGQIIHATDSFSGTLSAIVENANSGSANNHAILDLRTQTATGGDPFVRYTINGVGNWAAGVDNDDSDTWKVSNSSGLGTNDYLRITTLGSVIISDGTTTANRTDKFLYVPASAGTPTGVPTTVTGTIPLVVDSTNHKLYFYSGGAWRDAGP